MMPYIEDTKPARTRLRIKNRIRLTIFLLFILCTLLAIFIPKTGSSQVEYRSFIVGYGDTYWDIAKGLQEQGYDADIRSIVHDLISKSGIPAHELRDGDTIFVPDINAP